MGWTSHDIRSKTSGEAIAEIVDIFRKEWKPGECKIREYHAANDDLGENCKAVFILCETKANDWKPWIACVLYELDLPRGEVYMNEQETSMGVSPHDCPLQWFDIVPARGEFEPAWREECRKRKNKNAQPKLWDWQTEKT